MLVPIRCFTCGKPIADKYATFRHLAEQGKNPADAMEELGLDRYCCKRMFLAQADLSEEIKKYPRF